MNDGCVGGSVHGRFEPCEDCGRPKSEYVDLGTHGIYRCWWCNQRAQGLGRSLNEW